MAEETFLTTADALTYLQTTQRTLYRLLAAGSLPAVRVGRQWRFRKSDLDSWVHRCQDRSTAGASELAPRRAWRLLIADDEAPVRETMTNILAFTDHKVDAVPDGLTAIARLQSEAYDLLITDVRMPGIDGLELAREAKKLWPGHQDSCHDGVPVRIERDRGGEPAP